MKKRYLKKLLATSAQALIFDDILLKIREDQIKELGRKFNVEVDRRKSAQAEWEAAQELSARLEGS